MSEEERGKKKNKHRQVSGRNIFKKKKKKLF